MKETIENTGYRRFLKPAIIVLVCAIILFSSAYTIKAGQRGVLLTFGKADTVAKDEGLHFKFPFVQKIVKMDVRTQKYEADLSAASKDLQDVKTMIAINFRIISDKVPEIYTTLGPDYIDNVIYPLEQETNKEITAQYSAEELITNRNEVKEQMKAKLVDKLKKRNIIVEEISIINFEFSPAFTQAIEAKVTAEQLKLKAEKDLERIKIEKEQKITQAQAEAESLKLQKMEITKELVDLRRIEMMQKAIEKWDGRMPQATSGMPFIDVTPKPEVQ